MEGFFGLSTRGRVFGVSILGSFFFLGGGSIREIILWVSIRGRIFEVSTRGRLLGSLFVANDFRGFDSQKAF